MIVVFFNWNLRCVWILIELWKELILTLIYISRMDLLTQANPSHLWTIFITFIFVINLSLPQRIFFINSLWINLELPRIYYLRQLTLGFATFNYYQSRYENELNIQKRSDRCMLNFKNKCSHILIMPDLYRFSNLRSSTIH